MAGETRCPGCEDSKLPLITHNYDESRWQVEQCCGWKGPTCDTRELAIAAWSKRVPNRAVEAVKDCHGCTHIWTNGFGVSYCAFRHGPINWRGCEHYLAVDAIRKEAADGK